MAFIIIIAFLILLSMFPTLRCAVRHPVKLLTNGCKDAVLYVRHKKKNNAPYGQILCYIADNSQSFGCGKTLSATDCIVDLYRNFNDKTVWCSRRKKFVTQKIKVISNVDFLTIPYERLVSLAQFVQWLEDVVAIDDKNDTLTVTYMVIDEASSQLNSRSFKSNFDGYFLSQLLTVRHVHASILLTSQRSGMIDKLLRDCCHQYIGCDKMWRFQRLNYYDAYEIENAQSPSLVQPIRRTCWFIQDSSFENYDTYASVEALKKSCENGDRLTEDEILALQVSQPVNMDGVTKPSRRWTRNKRKQHK